MRRGGKPLGFTAAALAGVLLAPLSAEARGCPGSRVIVCRDCVREVSVTMAPDGTCRLSFQLAPRPGRRAVITLTPARGETVSVEVASEPAASRPGRKRVAGGTTTAGRCFTFSDRRWCE